MAREKHRLLLLIRLLGVIFAALVGHAIADGVSVGDGVAAGLDVLLLVTAVLLRRHGGRLERELSTSAGNPGPPRSAETGTRPCDGRGA